LPVNRVTVLGVEDSAIRELEITLSDKGGEGERRQVTVRIY
jgi:hypothetical protein